METANKCDPRKGPTGLPRSRRQERAVAPRRSESQTADTMGPEKGSGNEPSGQQPPQPTRDIQEVTAILLVPYTLGSVLRDMIQRKDKEFVSLVGGGKTIRVVEKGGDKLIDTLGRNEVVSDPAWMKPVSHVAPGGGLLRRGRSPRAGGRSSQRSC